MSLIGIAVTDEEFHLNFDYISIYIRCTKFLSALRKSFFEGAGDNLIGKHFKEVNFKIDLLAEATVSCVFFADPDAAQAVEVTVPMLVETSRGLREGNVSLENLSLFTMASITIEGIQKVKGAAKLCGPVRVKGSRGWGVRLSPGEEARP